MGRCTYSNGCIDLYLFLWLGFSCLSQQKSNDYGETDTRSLRNTSRVLAMDVLLVFANFFSFPFFFFLSFIAKKLSKSAMLAEFNLSPFHVIYGCTITIMHMRIMARNGRWETLWAGLNVSISRSQRGVSAALLATIFINFS